MRDTRCYVCLAIKYDREHQRYAAGWFNWYQWLLKADPGWSGVNCGAHDIEMAAELLRRD